MKKNAVEAIVEALNACHTKYMIAGGLAVVAHGYVRFTADVDVVLALDKENVLNAMKALASLGYRPRVPVKAEDFADPQLRRKWMDEKGMLVFSMISDKHRETTIDLFVDLPFDFDSEYKLAKWFELAHGVKAPFVGIDRLIQMKESAHREKDLLDINALKKIREKLAGE